MRVAALYVEARGCYSGLDDVDVWDELRDARLYNGPYPVVAHPPCQRWGRYWHGGPSVRVRKVKGDDGGCFAAALEAVKRWGGVLEHPEASAAWGVFEINRPPKEGGWVRAGLYQPGWTCCVEQGHYGHRARKATWLYANGTDLPELAWGPAEGCARLDGGYKSAEERAEAQAKRGKLEGRDVGVLTKVERIATPLAFRDELLRIARTAKSCA